MEIFAVKSKFLKQVGYDCNKSILFIKFKTKEIYHYFEVPYYEYFTLLNIDCKDTYFNTRIKNNYEYTKIK